MALKFHDVHLSERGHGKKTRSWASGAAPLLASVVVALLPNFVCVSSACAQSAEVRSAETPSAVRPTALVVCPTSLRTSLQPWIEYRESQGIGVTVIPSAATAAKLQTAIAKSRKPSDRFLFIVGDAPVIGAPVDQGREVPMHYVPTTVTAKFGSTPTMATDYPYGDTNGDGQTDVAVGRLPVDTPEQLHAMIARIKGYEASRDFSLWRERIQLVGGVGGFGMLADATIESVTRMMVTASLPTAVRTSVAYGSPGHLFYPRERFTDSITSRYSEGCRFWVYAGHGMVDRLDQVPAGPTGVPVLDSQSISNLQCDPANAPIAVLLCCFTGAIDAGVDSFAERLLLHRCGPIAVIAGNRVTMPYGNASLTLGLIDAIYGQGADVDAPSERIGEAWLHAVRRLEAEDAGQRTQLRTLLDTVATLVSPAGTKLEDERSEHAALYALLGDPLLKLHPPAPVKVETEPGFDHGAAVVVSVTSPVSGDCVVMLDHPLGESRRSKPGTAYIDPNEITLAQATAPVLAGETKTFTIPLEESRSGALLIRVHVSGEDTWAAGGGQTNLRPPKDNP